MMGPGLGVGREDKKEISKVNQATLDLETEQTWMDAEGAVKTEAQVCFSNQLLSLDPALSHAALMMLI